MIFQPDCCNAVSILLVFGGGGDPTTEKQDPKKVTCLTQDPTIGNRTRTNSGLVLFI